MALADDELFVGKNHARNGEWIDITIKKVNILLFMNEDSNWQNYLKYINIDLKDDLLALKQAKLEAVTFQIQNTELTKLNHALQDQLKEERKVNEKWLNSSNKVSQYISEQIPNQKKKILGGEQLTESSSKNDAKDNPFVPASLDYDHEMVPKSKVSESEAVNECLQLTKASSDFESSKESGSEFQTPLPLLKNLQGVSPSAENVSGLVTVSNPKPVTSSVLTEVKTNDQESKINELTKLPESSKSVNSSKQSQDSKPNGKNLDSFKPLRLKPLQKPKLKCELCNYTNHSTDDCYRILYCMKCKREDHRTSDHDMYIASLKVVKTTRHNLIKHNRVIQMRGRVLVESSQSSESSIGVSCTTYGSNVHSATDHNDFEHFKRETHQGAYLVPGQWMLKEYDWCQELSAQICRAT
ncbi:hypothetical protein Tco_1443662, partial [Tanacetum coccineum]